MVRHTESVSASRTVRDHTVNSQLGPVLATNLLIVGFLMITLWVIGTIRKDVSLVDPFWGLGFTIIAWTSSAMTSNTQAQALLVSALTSLWGLRLSLYLIGRNWGHSEDRRYGAMREYHQANFWLVSLVTVFLAQGLIMWIVAMPIQAAISNPTRATSVGLNLCGILVWIVGLTFETVGDLQLARFKSDPNNAHRVMDRGLWRYTRHPNYFGDFCIWWGIYLVCAAAGAWWTIFSPILMTILLLRISGVRLLESTITSRRPEYQDYQSRTSAFFPWRPSR